MILVPQPKKMESKEGTFALYGSDIYISFDCPENIYIASKRLKGEMKNNACGFVNIKKTLSDPEKGVYLCKNGNGDEGYTIDITKNYVKLCGNSDKGLFYAIMTLIQIIRQERNTLSCIHIEDKPDFESRCFYYDVTRGRIPTLQSLKKAVDMIAFYKYNEMQIYIQHVFAFEGFEELYTGKKGHLTAEELIELQDYCEERYIELVPSIASMGHLFFLMETQQYKHLCAIKDYEADIPFNWHERFEHHTIDITNPESAEVIKKLYDQILPIFKSKKFNITCDEAMDLCYGLDVDKAEAFAKYVSTLYDYLKGYGKEVQIWGDMLEKNPEILKLLPEDITILIWEYYHPPRDENIGNQLKSGLATILCASTMTNNALIPIYTSKTGKGWVSIPNIKGLAELAFDKNLKGVMLTHWGDYFHTVNFSWIIPCIAYAGEKFWNAVRDEDMEAIDGIVSEWEFSDTTRQAIALMKKISLECNFSFAALCREHMMKTLGGNDLPMKPYVPVSTPTPDEKSDINKEKYLKIVEYLPKLAALNLGDRKDELLSGVEGVMILLAIELAKYDPVLPHKELARKAEIWLEYYMATWRQRNKEGEIREVVEYIKYFTKILYQY